jgi:hypothetical protein
MPEYYKTQKGYCYKKTQKGGAKRISNNEYNKKTQKGGAKRISNKEYNKKTQKGGAKRISNKGYNKKRGGTVPLTPEERKKLVEYIDDEMLPLRTQIGFEQSTEGLKEGSYEQLLDDKCVEYLALKEGALRKEEIFTVEDVEFMRARHLPAVKKNIPLRDVLSAM